MTNKLQDILSALMHKYFNGTVITPEMIGVEMLKYLHKPSETLSYFDMIVTQLQSRGIPIDFSIES
jgi:hypothetical protein